MELSELQNRIAELKQQIELLPTGSITKKTVNGRVYFYHRWTEEKKRREKYLPAEEVDSFREKIERRKALEKDVLATGWKMYRTGASAETVTGELRLISGNAVVERSMPLAPLRN